MITFELRFTEIKDSVIKGSKRTVVEARDAIEADLDSVGGAVEVTWDNGHVEWFDGVQWTQGYFDWAVA